MEQEKFMSKDEEALYFRKRLQECQIELEEYQESSRELESELETQLNASEKRNTELKQQNLRLQTENESLKLKLTNLNGQTSDQLMELRHQLSETQVMNAKLTRCIRELEQSNDDLERAKRALHASLEDFEKKLNQQIEKNVLLENELGEKEQLEEIIQRLKDEARDLKQELLVQQQIPTNSHSSFESMDVEDDQSNKKSNQINVKQSSYSIRPNNLYYDESTKQKKMQLNNKLLDECKLNQANTTDLPSCSLLSPSTRVSVLNIVSDLLRKVGALESRLNQTSCKSINNSTISATATSNSPIKNALNN